MKYLISSQLRRPFLTLWVWESQKAELFGVTWYWISYPALLLHCQLDNTGRVLCTMGDNPFMKYMFLSPLWRPFLTLDNTNCSHLDIFISQKTGSLCSEFVRPISNNLRGQMYKILDLKIQIFYTHPSFIFTGIVKSSTFWTLLMLFQKGWNTWVTFLRQIKILILQLFGIEATVCKKQSRYKWLILKRTA